MISLCWIETKLWSHRALLVKSIHNSHKLMQPKYPDLSLALANADLHRGSLFYKDFQKVWRAHEQERHWSEKLEELLEKSLQALEHLAIQIECV